MPDLSSAYPLLVYLHLLLFTFWLGADLGVFILGQHFRKRSYSLPERLTILKLLVITDMGPRTAWALMVPSSLAVLDAGGWWDVPSWLTLASLAAAAAWLTLVWTAHQLDLTRRGQPGVAERIKALRSAEGVLKYSLTAFYLILGIKSLATGAPLAPEWLAWKALLFGLIFLAAIMIDVWFKPVGPLLVALVQQGSSDATEVPLRRQMDRTRLWVFATYALLVVTSYLGATKPG